jgi:uncharacterized membrane protein
MTDTSTTAARFAESDFRVGGVLNRTMSVLSRHFPLFFAITLVANLPMILMTQGAATATTDPDQAAGYLALVFFGFVLFFVLNILSQAVIVHAAFQAMRGRPASLAGSLGVGLARFLPIIGLAFISGFLIVLAGLLLIVPGLILITMWFVGTQVCVVERLGPWASLKRSAQLTKGHRWKVFGLMLLLIIVSVIGSTLIELALAPFGSLFLTGGVSLIWNAIWGAYYAVAVVVTYHDLRVAKEGIDIEQIASVFD